MPVVGHENGESEEVQRMLRDMNMSHEAMTAGIDSLIEDDHHVMPAQEILERLTNSFTEHDGGAFEMALGEWELIRVHLPEMSDEFRHGLLLGIMATKQAMVYYHDHESDPSL